MRILVTGLCLSRNLGGPAMGLTLVEQLRKRLGNSTDFVFAVTPYSFQEETEWAEHYGLEIVRRDTAIQWWLDTSTAGRFFSLSWRVLKLIRRKIKRGEIVLSLSKADANAIHIEFMTAFNEVDAVVDMSGISYVGDGVRGAFEGVRSYSNFYYAKKCNKPFTRFIQSFGPFDDWKVSYFAKKEFASLPFIPARGPNSASFCKKIVKDINKVCDFPDSAILLPKNTDWAEKYIQENNIRQKNYVIVSPSSVIYKSVRTSVGGSVGNKHIESMIKVCNMLIDKGEYIVFLPHMYSRNPEECDRHVAKLIASNLPHGAYHVIEKNIDPKMAKGLIALSKYAIVSRYHALVAALSTGVDVITMGWNIKYQDIMEYYGKEKYAVDIRAHEPDSLVSMIQSLLADFPKCVSKTEKMAFQKAQSNAEEKIHHAFDLLSNWIEKSLKQKNYEL